MPLNIQSTTEEKVKITIRPRTPRGNPAQVEAGTLEVSVVQGDATVQLIDATSFFCISQDGPITPETLDTVYSLSADADLGTGIRTITDTVTYHVTGAEASDLGTEASPAEPK